jgi:hypothetical protein
VESGVEALEELGVEPARLSRLSWDLEVAVPALVSAVR